MKGTCCVARGILGAFLSAMLVLPVVPLSAFAETAEFASADLGGVANAGDSDEGATDGVVVGGGSADEGSLAGALPGEVDAAQGVDFSSELQDVAFNGASQIRDTSVSDDDPVTLSSASLAPRLDYSGAPTSGTGSIACGQPVTFALSATGGSGSYQYMFTSVSLDIDGERSIVHNMTSSGFSDANTFVYTFVASGTYYLYCSVRDTVTNGFKSLTERIVVNDLAYPRVEDLAQRVVDECNAKGYKTEYEKALFYNNFIVDNVEYDYSYKESSALGAFAKGKAVCEGYYQALKMLLVRSRIQCVRTPANGHVWATVRLDGVWTQVDPTKDDDATAPFENVYFGITDEMSELVHDGYRRNPAYPCNSTAANYLFRSGEVAKYVSKAETEIRQKLTQGNESFTVALDRYAPFKEVYHAFYPMVVAELRKRVWGDRALDILYVKTESKDVFTLNDSYLQVDVICSHETLTEWQFDAAAHWKSCTECDNRFGQAPHAFGPWTAPSSNLFFDVSRSRTCSTCGFVQEGILRAKLPGYSDFSTVYDSAYYAANNPDVRNAFQGDEVQMFWHFHNWGMAEGRRASDGFDAASYYNANPDVRAAFGTDVRALTMHYVSYGQREGRACAGVPELRGHASSRGGLSYAAVYDGARYAQANPDVVAACTVRRGHASLLDDRALLRHFVDWGMAEGRESSDGFDVHAYRARYADLRAAYGSDLRAYYMHYVNYGQREGRDAA